MADASLSEKEPRPKSKSIAATVVCIMCVMAVIRGVLSNVAEKGMREAMANEEKGIRVLTDKQIKAVPEVTLIAETENQLVKYGSKRVDLEKLKQSCASDKQYLAELNGLVGAHPKSKYLFSVIIHRATGASPEVAHKVSARLLNESPDR
jgi:hypothetical protein